MPGRHRGLGRDSGPEDLCCEWLRGHAVITCVTTGYTRSAFRKREEIVMQHLTVRENVKVAQVMQMLIVSARSIFMP